MRSVWRNEVGGLTFEVDAEPDRCFVKWSPTVSGIDLRAEARRLEWAQAFTPVPRVLDMGADDRGTWLVTAALAGQNAVATRWKTDPATAVIAIGRDLRLLHDRLPVQECPFSWSAQDRLAVATTRAAADLIDRQRWHAEHRSLPVENALQVLADIPPTDHLVVCHGDACAPNMLLTDDGQWSGHVDLGSMGIADRWADIAIATWSTQWNYGPGWENLLLNAYGATADPLRTRYYRLLWEFEP